MGTILCATDLTPAARPAVAAATALCRALGDRLELFHVVQVPPELPPELINESMVGSYRESAEAAIRAQVAALRSEGLDVDACVRLGFVDDAIAQRAGDIGAELLVVGTHARKAAQRLFLGSVAERTIRAAPCPTLVVPPLAAGRLTRGERPAGPLKITAAIDLSPASDAALAWLRDLAERTRCDLRLVHVYWPPREHERLGFDPPLDFEIEPGVTEVLTRELRGHIVAELGRDDVPLRVRPSWGAEEDPLSWEAETDDADLLVVGTSQGRASTAVATVRGAHLPVVCVPRRAVAAPARALSPVRTVMVTTDFSPLASAAIPEAYRLLLRGGGEVVLVHVAAPKPLGLDPDRQNELETTLLGLVPPGVENHAIRTRTFVTTDPSPGEAVVKAILRFAPDLVVMSSHGRSGIGRALHGSVAEHVVRHSAKPVLVVPPPPSS